VFSRTEFGVGGVAARLNCAILVAITLATMGAWAQESKKVEATAEGSIPAAAAPAASGDGSGAPEPLVEPLERKEPERPPEPAKAPDEKPLISFYGIIKPEIIVGAAGVETFGKAIPVAPTAAAHPIADPNYNQAFSSFQLQQSRFGMKIGEGKPLSGKIEIDFIDDAFSHSSPIQGAGMRLRLAYVTYKFGPAHSLMVGQNWDVFSPLNALTMNLVGNSFQAGNVAFLRPQVAYTYGTGEGIEITGAIGLRTQNTGATMNFVETGLLPTFALQAGYKKGKNWFGASGIFGAEETVANPRTYNVAVAANLFANLVLNEKITLIVEGYFGKSTNSLGLLALGSGANVLDAGAYVAGKFQFTKVHGALVTLGAAGVFNPAELSAGYTAAVLGPPAVAATRVGLGGIESNINLRATYVLSPMEGLQFYAEPYLFVTRFRLAALDDPTGSLANRTAFGVQVGTRYNF
jgi:hypothetical protein